MQSIKTLYVTTRKEWREWLQKNHSRESVTWLLYYKKHTCKPRIPYEEAVEEALCFGWIDSIIKRIDEISYCQKFTPRRSGSSWSESNIKRAKEMIASGKMTEAGLALYEETITNSALIIKRDEKKSMVEIPDDMKRALHSRRDAYKNFIGFPRSYSNMCIRWIEAAKREDTRKRRIMEVVEFAEKGEKIGLK